MNRPQLRRIRMLSSLIHGKQPHLHETLNAPPENKLQPGQMGQFIFPAPYSYPYNHTSMLPEVKMKMMANARTNGVSLG
jgi:hypothetical protein